MTEIDLGLGILDHQLLDCDDRRCGKVDDLELVGMDTGRPRVSELLVGPRALRERGRIGRLVAALAPARTVRVPWEDVAGIEAVVRLRRPAEELRLGRGDDRMRGWVERIPGARR